MAEIAAGLLRDIGLHAVPVVLIVADFFAVHADRKQLLELPELRGEFDDPLGDAQPHRDRLAVERLCEEVVHTCVHRLAQVLPPGVVRGEEDEVGVVRLGPRAHLAAEIQAVQAGHHPVAHDYADRFGVECRPCGLAAVGRHDLVAAALQCDLKDLCGDHVILGDQDFHADFASTSICRAMRT